MESSVGQALLSALFCDSLLSAGLRQPSYAADFPRGRLGAHDATHSTAVRPRR